MSKAFGIDLGTTNSVVASYSKGTPEIVLIEGQRLVPSVVYYDPNDNIVVGQQAKKRVIMDPGQTLSSTKRDIGTNWKKKINGVNRTPIDSAKQVLDYLKRETERTTGEKMDKVVITVPAYFDDEQREATLKAAKQAGLNVLRLLPEPTAAAICHGFNKEKDQSILVIDLGGGTFDVSLLEVKKNSFEEKIIEGDRMLGGDDFDNKIIDYMDAWVRDKYGRSIKDDPVIRQKLKENAEKVKIELSTARSTDIYIPQIVSGVDIEIERFTIDQYKQLIQPYLNIIVEKTRKVLKDARTDITDINRVVLVGGSCKHPIIKELITESFKTPYFEDDMDTAVARGAAIFCHSLLLPTDVKERVEVSNVIVHSLGIDMRDSKTGRLNFIPILKRNGKMPAKGAIMGFTREEQDQASISVYRGEHIDMLDKNVRLGELHLPIEGQYTKHANAVGAIFELDINGILKFTAVQIPATPDIFEDPSLKRLMQSAEDNDNVVNVADMVELVQRHRLKTKEITVQTT